MRARGIQPDAVTFGTLLVKNVRLGTPDSVQVVLEQLARVPFEQLDIQTITIWLR